MSLPFLLPDPVARLDGSIVSGFLSVEAVRDKSDAAAAE